MFPAGKSAQTTTEMYRYCFGIFGSSDVKAGGQALED